MPQENKDFLKRASEYWSEGRPLDAGRLIFKSVPINDRPAWAARILREVVERTGTKAQPIEHILQLASVPDRWKEAHRAFSEARDMTLKLEKAHFRSRSEKLLLPHLLLAELVAKVTYNATNPDDEFDEDSGWWIAVCLKDILDSVSDSAFSEKMWQVLCNESEGATK